MIIPANNHKYCRAPTPAELGLIDVSEAGRRQSGQQLKRMKKFRFQLLAEWIIAKFAPCRTADVGGGKGILAFLLRQAGFDAVVIDPFQQQLPQKFRNFNCSTRIKLSDLQDPPRIVQQFRPEQALDFDLLVAMHAHGCNMALIDVAAKYNKSLVLLPCCVIDEPAVPPVGQNWFIWLSEYATSQGLAVNYFYLNFKGQNVGFYYRNT